MALQGDFWSFSEDGKPIRLSPRDRQTPWRNFLFTDRLKSTLIGDVWTVNGLDTPRQPADWICTHGFGTAWPGLVVGWGGK